VLFLVFSDVSCLSVTIGQPDNFYYLLLFLSFLALQISNYRLTPKLFNPNFQTRQQNLQNQICFYCLLMPAICDGTSCSAVGGSYICSSTSLEAWTQ
jgi:hypothetical protein